MNQVIDKIIKLKYILNAAQLQYELGRSENSENFRRVYVLEVMKQ